MSGKEKMGAGIGVIGVIGIVGCTAAACVLGAALFVESGFYDIGADDHHTKIFLGIIEQLRERSIAVRDRSIDLRIEDAPERIAAGAEHYAALCAGCHLAPGITTSEIRRGLYPHPPNLAQEDLRDGRRAFWIIKHGIKMSAMPAWGQTLDDAAIWELVSFIRQMPDMNAETYRQISHR
jgi:mono/diheme cytochrome c family protein